MASTPSEPARLTDLTPIHDERAECAIEARYHRDCARRSTALAIGSGDIGTYRILMAFATEHEARAVEVERRPKRRPV